ncbi:MAG: ABC transporter ATP-binding protein [Bryobacteraceae bacterium]
MADQQQTPQSFMNGWRDRLKALRNLPPVWRMLWKSGPVRLMGSVISRILGALIPLSMLAVTRWIIDAIVAHSKGTALPGYFWWLVGLEFGLAALGGILGRTTWYYDTLIADRFTRYVSVRVMEHASRLDLASYEDPAFADKLERARAQATDRTTMIQAMGTLLQQVVLALTYSATIFFFSPWLLVVLIICVVPAFLGESHFAFQGYSLSFSQTQVRRQLDYLRTLGASKESAKELKLFGLARFLTDRFFQLSKDIYRQNRDLATRRLFAGALLSLLTTSGYYGAYAYVIYRTVTGDLSVGTLTFLTGAIAGASSNIQMIFSTFSNIADQALFLKDLMEFFAVQPVLGSNPSGHRMPRPIREGFVFDRVSFSYPGSPRLVLNNLNFRLRPGERLALIGENGQGKTTIVKLLTRLYEPTVGRILLDGIDLREYNAEDLASETGVIFQDFMRYEMTARDNIAIGRIERQGDLENIMGAARKSLADEPISRLPQGFEQMLGRRFEGGVDLSGGEWQKIALARAYLRDAQLLILDEPTASLDARSESEVFQRFAELTEGKMAIVISHRFSSVRMADRILVLEDGHIAEEGSHDWLMELGGRYSHMFEMQASAYR